MRIRRLSSVVLGLVVAGAIPASVVAHGAGTPIPTDPVGLALAWQLDVPIILGLLAASAGYVLLARRVNAAHPANRWPIGRTVAFLVAIAAIATALLSIIDTLADDLLTVHMIQHLLLVSIAAPLLALSGIGTLALRAARPAFRQRWLLPALHSRAVSALTFPLVGGLAFVVVLWGSHFTRLYDLALTDETIHAAEHALYLGIAVLFWWPLLSPDPLRWRLHPGAKLIALLMQMIPMSFLAVTIMSASRPLYSAYIGRPEAFGIDVLTDQRIAGSLMWLTNDFAFLVPAAYILLLLTCHEEAETRRVDARLARLQANFARAGQEVEQ